MIERLESLEQLVGIQGQMIDQMAEQLVKLTARSAAMRALLVRPPRRSR